MKRLKKIIVAVVVLVAILLVALVIWIDQVAKIGIETGATYALGVTTTLDKMDISIVSGSATFAKLTVANPPGFTTPHFLHLNKGRVTVALGSLMDEKVVIPELTLSGIDMNLERIGTKSNYKVILDSLKKLESQQSDQPKQQPKKSKKFVIAKVVIEDVSVQVDLLPIGGKLTRVPVKITRIELENLGDGDDQGVAMAELTAILTEAILTAVVEQAGSILPADIIDELTAGLEGLMGLGGATIKVAGQVVTGIGQVTQQIGQGLQDAGKQLGEGLGKLLGKKQDADK